MYKIIQNGETLSLTDKLHYIRLHDNGCFVATDEETAEGIVVNGIAYSLAGHELKGAAGTVIAVEADAGAELATLQAENAELKTDKEQLNDEVNMLMLALIEEHEQREADNAELKQELSELKGG